MGGPGGPSYGEEGRTVRRGGRTAGSLGDEATGGGPREDLRGHVGTHNSFITLSRVGHQFIANETRGPVGPKRGGVGDSPIGTRVVSQEAETGWVPTPGGTDTFRVVG